jgi:hypothetical protein
MMMWRQRVAATKIDSPLMAVSGRHLEDGKVCDTDDVGGRGGWVINTFFALSLIWHRCTQVRRNSISARDRVRDLRGMAGVACFTMNANRCHPTTQPPPQPPNHLPPNPQLVLHPGISIQIQLRQSFIEIVLPALRSSVLLVLIRPSRISWVTWSDWTDSMQESCVAATAVSVLRHRWLATRQTRSCCIQML